MTRKQFAVTIARVRQELENIGKLLDELAGRDLLAVDEKSGPRLDLPDDSFCLRSIGSVLHDFYMAVEKIMKAVAKSVDGVVPQGPNWHRELLVQMTLSVPQVRPPVISTETAVVLLEFLAFRHVFRNVYGFGLSAVRLGELLPKLPGAAKRLEDEVTRFLAAMEEVLPEGSEAD